MEDSEEGSEVVMATIMGEEEKGVIEVEEEVSEEEEGGIIVGEDLEG